MIKEIKDLEEGLLNNTDDRYKTFKSKVMGYGAAMFFITMVLLITICISLQQVDAHVISLNAKLQSIQNDIDILKKVTDGLHNDNYNFILQYIDIISILSQRIEPPKNEFTLN